MKEAIDKNNSGNSEIVFETIKKTSVLSGLGMGSAQISGSEGNGDASSIYNDLTGDFRYFNNKELINQYKLLNQGEFESDFGEPYVFKSEFFREKIDKDAREALLNYINQSNPNLYISSVKGTVADQLKIIANTKKGINQLYKLSSRSDFQLTEDYTYTKNVRLSIKQINEYYRILGEFKEDDLIDFRPDPDHYEDISPGFIKLLDQLLLLSEIKINDSESFIEPPQDIPKTITQQKKKLDGKESFTRVDERRILEKGDFSTEQFTYFKIESNFDYKSFDLICLEFSQDNKINMFAILQYDEKLMDYLTNEKSCLKFIELQQTDRESSNKDVFVPKYQLHILQGNEFVHSNKLLYHKKIESNINVWFTEFTQKPTLLWTPTHGFQSVYSAERSRYVETDRDKFRDMEYNGGYKKESYSIRLLPFQNDYLKYQVQLTEYGNALYFDRSEFTNEPKSDYYNNHSVTKGRINSHIDLGLPLGKNFKVYDRDKSITTTLFFEWFSNYSDKYEKSGEVITDSDSYMIIDLNNRFGDEVAIVECKGEFFVGLRPKLMFPASAAQSNPFNFYQIDKQKIKGIHEILTDDKIQINKSNNQVTFFRKSIDRVDQESLIQLRYVTEGYTIENRTLTLSLGAQEFKWDVTPYKVLKHNWAEKKASSEMPVIDIGKDSDGGKVPLQLRREEQFIDASQYLDNANPKKLGDNIIFIDEEINNMFNQASQQIDPASQKRIYKYQERKVTLGHAEKAAFYRAELEKIKALSFTSAATNYILRDWQDSYTEILDYFISYYESLIDILDVRLVRAGQKSEDVHPLKAVFFHEDFPTIPIPVDLGIVKTDKKWSLVYTGQTSSNNRILSSSATTDDERYVELFNGLDGLGILGRGYMYIQDSNTSEVYGFEFINEWAVFDQLMGYTMMAGMAVAGLVAIAGSGGTATPGVIALLSVAANTALVTSGIYFGYRSFSRMNTLEGRWHTESMSDWVDLFGGVASSLRVLKRIARLKNFKAKNLEAGQSLADLASNILGVVTLGTKLGTGESFHWSEYASILGLADLKKNLPAISKHFSGLIRKPMKSGSASKGTTSTGGSYQEPFANQPLLQTDAKYVEVSEWLRKEYEKFDTTEKKVYEEMIRSLNDEQRLELTSLMYSLKEDEAFCREVLKKIMNTEPSLLEKNTGLFNLNKKKNTVNNRYAQNLNNVISLLLGGVLVPSKKKRKSISPQTINNPSKDLLDKIAEYNGKKVERNLLEEEIKTETIVVENVKKTIIKIKDDQKKLNEKIEEQSKELKDKLNSIDSKATSDQYKVIIQNEITKVNAAKFNLGIDTKTAGDNLNVKEKEFQATEANKIEIERTINNNDLQLNELVDKASSYRSQHHDNASVYLKITTLQKQQLQLEIDVKRMELAQQKFEEELNEFLKIPFFTRKKNSKKLTADEALDMFEQSSKYKKHHKLSAKLKQKEGELKSKRAAVNQYKKQNLVNNGDVEYSKKIASKEKEIEKLKNENKALKKQINAQGISVEQIEKAKKLRREKQLTEKQKTEKQQELTSLKEHIESQLKKAEQVKEELIEKSDELDQIEEKIKLLQETNIELTTKKLKVETSLSELETQLIALKQKKDELTKQLEDISEKEERLTSINKDVDQFNTNKVKKEKLDEELRIEDLKLQDLEVNMTNIKLKISNLNDTNLKNEIDDMILGFFPQKDKKMSVKAWRKYLLETIEEADIYDLLLTLALSKDLTKAFDKTVLFEDIKSKNFSEKNQLVDQIAFIKGIKKEFEKYLGELAGSIDQARLLGFEIPLPLHEIENEIIEQLIQLKYLTLVSYLKLFVIEHQENENGLNDTKLERNKSLDYNPTDYEIYSMLIYNVIKKKKDISMETMKLEIDEIQSDFESLKSLPTFDQSLQSGFELRYGNPTKLDNLNNEFFIYYSRMVDK